MASHSSNVKPGIVTRGETPLLMQDTVWDDIRVAASSAKINPVTSKPDYGDFLAPIQTFLFAASGGETITFQVQVPHSYKFGTDLEPHIHWSPTTTGTGTVGWEMSYINADIGSDFATAATTLSAQGTVTATASLRHHYYTDFPGIAGGSVLSHMFMCSLTRTGGTYADDVALLEIDFHFQMDTLGSKEELVK